jgi:hypothetical protein
MPDATAVRNAASAFRPARRPALFVALLALFVVAIPGSAVAAAPSSDWTQQTTAHSPPSREGASMDFDPATGKIVVFGGFAPGPLADTWTYDGTDWDWTQQTPAHSPPARYDASMAFDSATGKIVLFGGTGNGGISVGDTWTYDGTDWTQQTTAHSPSARSGASMAFDPATGTIVLFGGDSSNSGLVADTWTYDGTDWTQQSPVHSPSVREIASMAFDPATGKIVLFGGAGNSGGHSNDTWTYDGTDWAQQSPVRSPAPREGASMDLDPTTGEIVLFGGAGDGRYFSDTWTYGTNPEPETTITHTPKNPKRAHTHFSFRSSIAGSTFRCMLDNANPEPCTSPQQYRNLEPGHHVFSVAATSPTGKSDPTPATELFRVKKPSR